MEQASRAFPEVQVSKPFQEVLVGLRRLPEVGTTTDQQIGERVVCLYLCTGGAALLRTGRHTFFFFFLNSEFIPQL